MSFLKLIPVVFTISILVLAVPFSAFAISFDPAIEILNPTPGGNEQFGGSVSSDGTNVLIGSAGDDTGATDAGAAYLYDSAGNLQLTFLNPAPSATDLFGNSVSLSGNRVLIGSFWDDQGDTDAGSVYMFDISSCDADTSNGGIPGDNICESATLTLLNPSPLLNDQFGNYVVISGNTALIGARNDDTGATDAGSAYYFDLTTCDDDTTNGVAGDDTCETATLTFENPTPISGDQFGSSVSISGNNALIGARNDDTGADNAGSAYYFDLTTCDDDTSNGGSAADNACEAEAITLLNPSPMLNDQFGNSVSIDGTNALVAAYGEDGGSNDEGAAYYFDLTICDSNISNGGSDGDTVCEGADQIFSNPTPVAGDFFGISTFMSGPIVVIGASFEDTGAGDSGAAYLFLKNAGGQVTNQVNILGTCGISVGFGTLTFDDLEPGATSSEEILTLSNTGTVASNVLVSGTDWVDDTPTTVMLVGTTAYADLTGNYASKVSLSGTPALILDDTQYLPDVPVDTFWQLLATLENPDFVGALTQEMTFSVDC